MSRKDDQRIANLARKNAAKIKPPTQDRAGQFDDTLRIRPQEQDPETKRMFHDMKKREF